MARKKATTLDKVTRTVVKAAKSMAATADEYVVEPVGKVLGLNKKKPVRKKTTKVKSGTGTKTATADAKTGTTAKKKKAGAKAVRK